MSTSKGHESRALPPDELSPRGKRITQTGLGRGHDALAQSEERFRLLLENAVDVIFRYRLHPQPAFEYVSPSVWRLTGHVPGEFYADFRLALRLVHPDDRGLAERQFGPGAIVSEPVVIRAQLDDGTEVWTEQRASGVYDERGELVAVEGILRDVTARIRAEQALEQARADLEQRLRQSQKLEAIGTLAGGIAHDFNNVLTAIIGCADVALLALDAGSPAACHLEELKSVARAGAGIVGQLMDLVRRSDRIARVVDLSELLVRREPLLRRLLGEDVELDLQLLASPAPVRCEPCQLEQVIMNLVVNARQAMTQGGRLCITISEVEISDLPKTSPPSPGPGRYVCLAVSDTGHGMDVATQQRIFDRFFTTKQPEQGTGLGLPTVYAIVTGCGGDVSVDSRIGQGSTFTLWFPWCTEPVAAEQPTPHPARGNGETVLVVEDEPLVRVAVRSYLERGGYRVVEASNAREARDLLRKAEVEIDVLLTDVVLPGESGPVLAAEAGARRRDLPVVYMSAYPAAVLEERQQIAPGAITLHKPFERQALLAAVQRAIERSRSAEAPVSRALAQPKCVLLVEDNAPARLAYVELLSGSGFEVLAAETGEKALRLFHENVHRIDAVVTDVSLPDMNGLELVTRLRDTAHEVAVLLLTGWQLDDPMFARVRGHTRTAFLQKPVATEALVRGIVDLLNS